MYISLNENWGLEINGYLWNPKKQIRFAKSLDITLSGDHRGVYFSFAFICVGLDLHVYDARHENEYMVEGE